MSQASAPRSPSLPKPRARRASGATCWARLPTRTWLGCVSPRAVPCAGSSPACAGVDPPYVLRANEPHGSRRSTTRNAHHTAGALRRGGGSRASRRLPPPSPAAPARARPALCCRSRQSRGGYGRCSRGALPQPHCSRPHHRFHDGPARHARGAHRCAAERHRHRLGTASDTRRGERARGRAHPCAGGNGHAARPRARAAVGRRVRAVGRSRPPA